MRCCGRRNGASHDVVRVGRHLTTTTTQGEARLFISDLLIITNRTILAYTYISPSIYNEEHRRTSPLTTADLQQPCTLKGNGAALKARATGSNHNPISK